MHCSVNPPHLVLRVVFVLAHKRLALLTALRMSFRKISPLRRCSKSPSHARMVILVSPVFHFLQPPTPCPVQVSVPPLQKPTSCRSSSKAFASEITLTETAQQQRTGLSQHHLPMCILHPAHIAVGTTVYKNLE